MLESDFVLKAFGPFRKQQSTAHPERETDVCGLLKVEVEMCLLEAGLSWRGFQEAMDE